MPVQKRSAGFVSRTVVPPDLRPFIRRREIVRSLGTGNAGKPASAPSDSRGGYRHSSSDSGKMGRPWTRIRLTHLSTSTCGTR